MRMEGGSGWPMGRWWRPKSQVNPKENTDRRLALNLWVVKTTTRHVLFQFVPKAAVGQHTRFERIGMCDIAAFQGATAGFSGHLNLIKPEAFQCH